MNAYFADSKVFLHKVAADLAEGLSKEQTILLTLYFALGIERLLKGILYDINPVFILVNGEFKNAAGALYAERLVPADEAGGGKQPEVNHDVISLRNSIQRAELFSSAVRHHKGTIFPLSQSRDIIVHHELGRLDISAASALLLRDFYPVVHAIVHEQSLNVHQMFAGRQDRLHALSAVHQDELEKRMTMIAEVHRKKWEVLARTPGYATDKENVVKHVLSTVEDSVPINCPACQKEAVLFLDPLLEFNPYEKRLVRSGFSIRKLKCYYCKLELERSDEIAFFNLYGYLFPDPRDSSIESDPDAAT